jgi:predicted GNAT family N-acyltransferase
MKGIEQSIKPIVAKSGLSISVNWFDEKDIRNRAVAEATEMGSHWFINRVLVQPEEIRSNGIGSMLLQILIKEIKKTGNKQIIVTPGGYAMNQKKQQNFYKKNGFLKEYTSYELMYYKGK